MTPGPTPGFIMSARKDGRPSDSATVVSSSAAGAGVGVGASSWLLVVATIGDSSLASDDESREQGWCRKSVNSSTFVPSELGWRRPVVRSLFYFL